MDVSRFNVRFSPEAERELSNGAITEAGALKLAHMARAILNYESQRIKPGADPFRLRFWLMASKKRLDSHIRRFSIDATIEAVTQNGKTEFTFKFKKHENDTKR